MGRRVKRKKEEYQGISIVEKNKKRLFIVGVAFTLCISSLVGRLSYIQLIKGNDYYARAASQWFEEIPIQIERGNIYDRNLIPLTNREKSNYLVIFPKHFHATEENFKIINQLTNISIDILKNRKLIGDRPIQLKIINHDMKLLKKSLSIRGVFPIVWNERYSSDGLASHVIGYINKIDNMGAKGIEKALNGILKKNQTYKIAAIVDAQKRMIPGIGYKILKEPSNSYTGKNVVTTLDYKIQKIIEEEFDKLYKRGSVVVVDVKSGDILGMLSRPNYQQDNVAAFLESKNKELYNRAIQIGYPPGSIFKIIVAAAAIENHVLNEKQSFFCKGYEEIGDVTIKCSSFEKGGHREIDLEKAFAVSCNSFFIQLGKQIGEEKLLKMAQKFGIGSLTGIGLSEEVSGNLPTKDHLKGAGIGNFSIGQGPLEVTPLQIAKSTAIIANNGIDKGVYLIKKVINDQGEVIQNNQRFSERQVISNYTAQKLQKMMKKVVKEGTASNIHLEKLGGAAGKTGSAQALSKGKDTVHAWFTGYFPVKNPQYVITIIIEDGGSGGKVAAPLFQKIAERIKISCK